MSQKKTMDELHRLSADEMRQAGKHPVIVILDDVRSMHNVGAVFRSCDGFAITALYLCGYTPTPPHRDIHKTALGATETVNWKHFTDVTEAIATCRKEGYKIWAVEQVHNSISLEQFIPRPDEKTVLVLGNEVAGVSERAIQMADGCIEIPQWGSKHSLNISVAAGIVLWETVKSMELRKNG